MKETDKEMSEHIHDEVGTSVGLSDGDKCHCSSGYDQVAQGLINEQTRRSTHAGGMIFFAGGHEPKVIVHAGTSKDSIQIQQAKLEETSTRRRTSVEEAESRATAQEQEIGPPSKRRKQDCDPNLGFPVRFSFHDDSSDNFTELQTWIRSEGESGGTLDTHLNDVVSEVRDVKSELLIGVLVSRERSAETRAELAARRLDRIEREKDEVEDAEYETSVEEALTNMSKVAKMIIDK